MCAISGIWFFNKEEAEDSSIISMNNSLSHRGPDGEGYYKDADEALQLAHRRLSIFDTSENGKQPMLSADKNWALTYNGEVYNFLELKQKLSADGISFRSDSDTEVLLAAWQRWKEKALDQFNGMWAFALWDAANKTLTVSRDRFGVKPLYYVYIPGKFFAFASEATAFKNLPFFKREIDKNNLSIALRDQYYLEVNGETIFEDIKQVRPGHNITVTGSGINIMQWWKTSDHVERNADDYEKQVKTFKELFTDSCALRLRSDVPVATALSGGLDSSSVFCTIKNFKGINSLQRLPARWQQAVVAVFPKTGADERKYAEEVIEFTGADAIFVEPSYNKLADEIIREVITEDFIYNSPPVVHHIYRCMKEQGIKVSLDGHGADELLFGYPADIFQAFKTERSVLSKNAFLQTYRSMIEGLDQPSLLSRGVNKVFSSLGNDSIVYGRSKFDKHYRQQFQCGALGAIDNISFQSFHVILPTLLRNWDRASMRHGVEIRMPFMDWRLVIFTLGLPVSSKVQDGFSKKILRDAMKGLLPPGIQARKNKIGIQAPMRQWFAGPLKNFIAGVVTSQSFLQSDVWNGKKIKNIVERQQKKKIWDEKACNQVWPVINAHLIIQSN